MNYSLIWINQRPSCGINRFLDILKEFHKYSFLIFGILSLVPSLQNVLSFLSLNSSFFYWKQEDLYFYMICVKFDSFFFIDFLISYFPDFLFGESTYNLFFILFLLLIWFFKQLFNLFYWVKLKREFLSI